VLVPRSAASGEGFDVALVLCTECGGEADERWSIVEQWTWWSDGCGSLLPFCPECADREFGHRVRAETRRTTSHET
jgi:hypothetical protein